MIKATQLQAETKRQLNRINSSYGTRVSTIDLDGFINESIDQIFENFAVKFEFNTSVRNHLRQLEVKNKEIKVKKLNKDSDYIEYPKDFYQLTRVTARGCKGSCEKVIDLFPIQTSDLSNALKDPYWKPSFEWEVGLYDDSANSLVVYHNCQYELKTLVLDYLRKTKHIATPSLAGCDYIIHDGTKISKDIDFEIDSSYFWRKVVKLAALEVAASLGDYKDYQAKKDSIMLLDKIFIN
jgi:hypothetical protein